MAIHIFNVFTCKTRPPFTLRTGMVCTLVETDQGLVLIDTGPGLEDYARPHWMMKTFKWTFITPMDPRETAIRQVQALGYKPEDVRHIILTHMHFDHCGGLPDFPWAAVHVHRQEYEAFTGGGTQLDRTCLYSPAYRPGCQMGSLRNRTSALVRF